MEATEEQVLDQATAARSIEELRIEIETLKRLESLALSIRRSGEDKKWRELATLLGEIFTTASIANGFAEDTAPYDAGVPVPPRPTPSPHQKLVIFTEHRDTLNYLHTRIAPNDSTPKSPRRDFPRRQRRCLAENLLCAKWRYRDAPKPPLFGAKIDDS